MKKIIGKIGKVLGAVNAFCVMVATKGVMATENLISRADDFVMKELYDVSNMTDYSTLYGPPSIWNSGAIIRTIGIILMPVVALIGLIVYFKRSESDKKKKILVTIAVIVITILIALGADKLATYISTL